MQHRSYRIPYTITYISRRLITEDVFLGGPQESRKRRELVAVRVRPIGWVDSDWWMCRVTVEGGDQGIQSLEAGGTSIEHLQRQMLPPCQIIQASPSLFGSCIACRPYISFASPKTSQSVLYALAKRPSVPFPALGRGASIDILCYIHNPTFHSIVWSILLTADPIASLNLCP